MRSFGLSPSVSRANDGPRTATTPMSDAEMPRYASDQAIAGLSRMYPMPSRSWPNTPVTAWPASVTASPARRGRALDRRVWRAGRQQNTAASANRTATMMISGCGPPAIVTMSGPSSA